MWWMQKKWMHQYLDDNQISLCIIWAEVKWHLVTKHFFSLLVALNYQTEGRMMQLIRAKFMVNGGIGYVLKPPPMCKGTITNILHAHKQAQIHASVMSLMSKSVFICCDWIYETIASGTF